MDGKVDHEGQYHLRVTKNGQAMEAMPIDDPFIVTTIVSRCSRWAALRAFLAGGFTDEYVVAVRGTPDAHRVVFGGDYSAEDAVRGQHEDALRIIGDRWREGERRRLR